MNSTAHEVTLVLGHLSQGFQRSFDHPSTPLPECVQRLVCEVSNDQLHVCKASSDHLVSRRKLKIVVVIYRPAASLQLALADGSSNPGQPRTKCLSAWVRRAKVHLSHATLRQRSAGDGSRPRERGLAAISVHCPLLLLRWKEIRSGPQSPSLGDASTVYKFSVSPGVGRS